MEPRQAVRYNYLIQIIFCLVGVGIIIWASILYSQVSPFKSFTFENYNIESCMMVSAGCLLTLSICLEVLCWCNHSCGQGLIFILQLSFYILLLSAGIQAIVHICDLSKSSNTFMTKALNLYGFENNTIFSNEIDNLQQNYECCGNVNYSDWFNTTWSVNHNGQLPSSCCASQVSNITECKYYTTGCNSKIQEIIYGYDVTISSVSLILFLIMLLSPMWTRKCRQTNLDL